MKYLISILLLFFTMLSFSQTELYYSEKFIKIDSDNFYNKCKRSIFDCKKITHNKDTLLYVTYPKYIFGKLPNSNLKKVNNYLNNGNTLENTYLIDSYDSIAIIANILNKSKYKIIKKVRNEKSNFFLEIQRERYKKDSFTISKKYIKKYKEYINKKGKCLKKYKKNNIKVLYYTDSSLINIYPSYDLISKRSSFFKLFNTNIYTKKYNIIIRPNGEFFMYYRRIPKNKLDKLLQADNWEKYKNSLRKSIEKRSKGFFDTMHYSYRNYTCH